MGSYESFWIGVQRFMYLNDLSGEDFLRLQYRRCHPAASPTASAFSRYMDKQPTTSKGTLPPNCLDELDSHTLRSEDRHRRACFHGDTPVRFCAKCLAHCYHSLLFQFPAVARCPYHDVELQLSCPKCGGLLSRLGFIPSKHPKPFCCTTCGKSFVSEKKVAQRVLHGPPDARYVLDAAYERMFLVAHTDVTSFSGFRTHDDAEDRFVSFHCHALHAAATGGAPLPRWWTGMASPVSYRPIRPSNSTVDSASAAEKGAALLTDHLRPMLAIVKSINRHFSRVIRTICKHRYPRELYCAFEKSSNAISPHHMRLDQLDCPCCAVLSWWRASWGYYMALHQAASLQSWRENQSWALMDVPRSSTQFAEAAWDSFMSLSIQMLYRVGPKSERLVPACRSLVQDSNHRNFASRRNLNVEAQRSLPQMGTAAFLDLEQPKMGDGSLICKDSGGKPCAVSYSLRNARQALAELHALRQSGPMTAIPQRSFQHSGDDFFDTWYRESWKRKELKNWSWHFRTWGNPSTS